MFKSLLNLIGSMFKVVSSTASNVTNKLVVFGITGVVCFIGWLLQTNRLGLWTNGPATAVAWSAFLWFVVWLCTSALWLHKEIKIASGIELVAVGLIIFQTITVLAPGTTKGASLVAAHTDKQNLERAQMATVEVIHPFDCNKTNSDTLSYFGKDGVTGQRVTLIKYVLDKKNHVICFREAGVYAKTGETVKDVTTDIIEMIEGQDPLVQQAAAPVAQPAVVASAPVPAQRTVTQAAPPEAPPVIEKSIQRSIPAGTRFKVVFSEPLDLNVYGEGSHFTKTLEQDITDSRGVLVHAGSPVGVQIVSSRQDPYADAMLLRMEVTSLTAADGTLLRVSAHHEKTIAIQAIHDPIQQESRPIGLHIKGLRLQIPTARVRQSPSKYILRPGRLPVTLDDAVIVPASR